MIALMLWIWLKVRGRGQGLGINRELLVFPFLIWLGMTMNIGNSVGRVAFMAFPAMILFQVLVIREFMKNAPSLRQG